MSFGTNPVVNKPFEAPRQHYQLSDEGQPTGMLLDGRRPSVQIVPVPQARRKRKDPELDLGDLAQRVEENRLVNRIRERVDAWRKSPDRLGRVTPETRRLLEHWTDPARTRRLFFCQVEALETLIYLTEVDPTRFRGQIEEANADKNPGLHRLASKMATGSGKTTVMAMIIAWHAVNKARRPNSKMFTDAFLVVCPGITIKDRLRVLMPSDPENVYAALDLVPSDLRDGLGKARIVITNYHAFMPKETEQVSKLNRQVLGGLDGEKRFTETDGQIVRRVAKDLMGRKGILVLNDEAHHCYEKADTAPTGALDAEEKDEAKENEKKALVWISGIRAFDRVLGVKAVHDLSATPFFLRGSGHEEGALFPWVVSDFSLLDAIESGIVKVPRIPVLDDRVAGEMPLFRNLYRNIQAGDRPLPRKGRAKQSKIAMDPQDLPGLLESALGALYGHYAEVHAEWEKQPRLGRPPVFIVVCNNTTTSKLIYDYIAGYEIEDPNGGPSRHVPGRLTLFQNIDDHGREARPMRTLLIDSEQLDSGEALSDEFLRVAQPEIARFKEEKRRRGEGDPEKTSPQDILREVMNTVGRPGKLGGDIRCVVSVSMLTEGWDANTVTHILGVRAFGTQLLCEQVVGRGLRRMSYEVGSDGRFPVEYADVLGIPFTFANASKTKTVPKPPPPLTHVRTRRDRPDLAIRFPRVQGYRLVFPRTPLTATFTANSRYELTPDMIPTQVENEPFIGQGITFDLREDAERLRLKSVIFDVAGHTLRKYFRDDEGAVEVWRFPELVRITERWFETCLVTRGEVPKQFMKFRQFADEAANRIHTACARGQSGAGESERTLPILDPFTPEGSTNHVDFTTTKTLLFETRLSPVDHVVADSEWELAFAETLERMEDVVVSYVKNHALHFEIPYHYAGAERRYRPDYVVRLRDGGAEPLNLVVEIKGLKDNRDAAKADVATGIWLPAVNHAARFGRWAFVEIGQDIYEAERVLRGIAAGKREAA